MAYTFGQNTAMTDELPVASIGQSGGESIRVYNVKPDAATGNITIDDATEVVVLAVIPQIETAGANSQVYVEALEDVTTTNQINFKLWQATNSAAATNFNDFRILVKVVR